MNISEIEKMVDDDIQINPTSKLDLVSLETPKLYNKYLKMLSRERLILKQHKIELNIIKLPFINYYGGISDPPYNIVLDKKQVEQHVSGEKTVIEQEKRIAMQDVKVAYLEKVTDSFSKRSFIISNAINYMKFMAGE